MVDHPQNNQERQKKTNLKALVYASGVYIRCTVYAGFTSQLRDYEAMQTTSEELSSNQKI